ncbi:hypothetical protein, partial [Enterococcus faecium]
MLCMPMVMHKNGSLSI